MLTIKKPCRCARLSAATLTALLKNVTLSWRRPHRSLLILSTAKWTFVHLYARRLHHSGQYGGPAGYFRTCGFADGMPVGMQLIGKPLDEETVLRAAYTFEQANEYHKVLAPLGGNK